MSIFFKKKHCLIHVGQINCPLPVLFLFMLFKIFKTTQNKTMEEFRKHPKFSYSKKPWVCLLYQHWCDGTAEPGNYISQWSLLWPVILIWKGWGWDAKLWKGRDWKSRDCHGLGGLVEAQQGIEVGYFCLQSWNEGSSETVGAQVVPRNSWKCVPSILCMCGLLLYMRPAIELAATILFTSFLEPVVISHSQMYLQASLSYLTY